MTMKFSVTKSLVSLGAVLLFTLATTTQAEVPQGEQLTEARALFDQINQSSKGAFGLNVLQGKQNRTTVRSGQMPEGGVVFQAALRNEPAAELAEKYGLYTGNLFSPNLFELFNDFVYKDPSANHDMPMEKLTLSATKPFRRPGRWCSTGSSRSTTSTSFPRHN